MTATTRLFGLLIILALITANCQDVERDLLVDMMIQDKLAERKKIFSDAIFRNCLEEIREDAQAAADSIIRTRISLNPVDSLVKPAKPYKPSFPRLLPPVDSFFVNPEKTIKRDSQKSKIKIVN